MGIDPGLLIGQKFRRKDQFGFQVHFPIRMMTIPNFDNLPAFLGHTIPPVNALDCSVPLPDVQ